MKKWLKNILSTSDEASHKRLISISSFIVLVLMVALNVFDITITPELIYVFSALCGGNSILTVIDKFKN